MTSLNDKEKAHENKFARDQETEFKIVAKRNKLLGFWAAEKLHKSGAVAEAYAKEVVASDFELPGDEDVVQKVLGDLTKAGISTTADEIRTKMKELLSEARK